MRIIKMMALAGVAYLATACNDGKTKISGEVSSDENQLMVFTISPNGTKPLDTVEVKNHKFSSNLKLDSADFVLVQVNDGYNVPLFVNPGEKIKLNLNGSDQKQSYEVSGSEESERIKEITDILLAARDRVDSLNTVSQEVKGTPAYPQKKTELDSIFQKVLKQTSAKYKSMIDEKPGSIANIFIFSQSIGNFPLVSAQDDFEYFEKVDSAIAITYPDLKHTKNFHQSIAKLRDGMAMQKKMEEIQKNISAGNEVPEIDMTGPAGKERKLSDLRGKVVLVDFWASWCRPCRAENPNVVRLYNEYKDKGFEVFSVSLDGLPQQQNPDQEWKAAIEQDGLIWPNHVSELKGWDSDIVMNFGIQGIPYTILVDRDGTIIGTELRGPELENKLKEIFGS